MVLESSVAWGEERLGAFAEFGGRAFVVAAVADAAAQEPFG